MAEQKKSKGDDLFSKTKVRRPTNNPFRRMPLMEQMLWLKNMLWSLNVTTESSIPPTQIRIYTQQ